MIEAFADSGTGAVLAEAPPEWAGGGWFWTRLCESDDLSRWLCISDHSRRPCSLVIWMHKSREDLPSGPGFDERKHLGAMQCT